MAEADWRVVPEPTIKPPPLPKAVRQLTVVMDIDSSYTVSDIQGVVRRYLKDLGVEVLSSRTGVRCGECFGLGHIMQIVPSLTEGKSDVRMDVPCPACGGDGHWPSPSERRR